MYGLKQIDNRNYRSLIIAGLGTIGRSLFILGAEQFNLFDHIFAVDRDDAALQKLQHSNVSCQAGNICEVQFLDSLMTEVPGPSLFVNLCSGTDNVKIRNHLALFDTAYLDSCASITEDPAECRFSRLMSYTYTEISSNYPHWLCWGINPGLVEIVARMMLAALPAIPRAYDVTVFEFDRLADRTDPAKATVGWCPEALVEEVMLSPAMEVVDGSPRECADPGALDSMVNWGSQQVPAKIVGHEDIWNLSGIPAVKNGRFYYSLNPAVMDILNMNDPGEARNRLFLPADGDIISGLEQVAVQVGSKKMASPQTLVWTESHAATWKQFGVNAVQYQTAKSLLLAIMLLQCTGYGLRPQAHNASNLPIAPGDWPIFAHFMEKLDIRWHDGTYLNLRAAVT